MSQRPWLIKILALGGTFLICWPLLAPVLLGIVLFLTRHQWLIDFLMPAEFFLSTLVGSGLLIWAAILAGQKIKKIIWSLSVAVFFLISSQGMAVITGLASGKIAQSGWQWWLVMLLFGFFLMADFFLASSSVTLAHRIIGSTNSPLKK